MRSAAANKMLFVSGHSMLEAKKDMDVAMAVGDASDAMTVPPMNVPIV